MKVSEHISKSNIPISLKTVCAFAMSTHHINCYLYYLAVEMSEGFILFSHLKVKI